jgi:tetratricopeptide (TPR) repeat protein
MMKLSRSLVLAILLCMTRGISAEPAGLADPVQSGYEALRDAVYNSEDIPRLEILYAQALAAVEGADPAPPDRGLWASRLEYLLARGYQAVGEKKQAAVHYEQGLVPLEELRVKGDSSEAWRMTSECISQLCLLKGLAFVMTNGPKVVSYARKALELDSRNAAAAIIVAASKVYPPALFGGDPKTGIALMQKALAMGTAERDDLFNIYSGIGIAFGKLGNSAEARAWLGQALELYPGHRFAREEYEKSAKAP